MQYLRAETFSHEGRSWTRWPEAPHESWQLGVDLGQAQDYTALCVLRHTRTPIPDEWKVNEARATLTQRVEEYFDVLALERLDLEMDYVRQAHRVQEVLNRPQLRGQCKLIIDQTGPGAAVGDIFSELGLDPVRIVLTGGMETTKHGGKKFGVPKSVLVSNVAAKLHTKELRFAPDLRLSEVVKEELRDFRRHTSNAGNALFQARGSKHDDIVLAVGLSLFWALERPKHRLRMGGLRGNY